MRGHSTVGDDIAGLAVFPSFGRTSSLRLPDLAFAKMSVQYFVGMVTVHSVVRTNMNGSMLVTKSMLIYHVGKLKSD